MSSESFGCKSKLVSWDANVDKSDSFLLFCPQEAWSLSPPLSSTSSTSYPKAILIPKDKSHEFQTRVLNLKSPVKIGRAFGKNSKPDKDNASFDCKVLSRHHAQLFYQDNKFYLQDTKSSNGTFVNSLRLSPANTESKPREVYSGDTVQFGVEVLDSGRKVTIGCILATLELYHPDGNEALPGQESLMDLGSKASKSELSVLALYLALATQREKALQKKLETINKILHRVQTSSEHSWKAMIEEDRLLRRIYFLQDKLQCVMDSVMKHPDNDLVSLRKKLLKVQKEKELYETKAKETFQQVLVDNMSVVSKNNELEISLKTSEEQRNLYRVACDDLADEMKQFSEEHKEQYRELQEMQCKCKSLEKRLDLMKDEAKDQEKQNGEETLSQVTVTENVDASLAVFKRPSTPTKAQEEKDMDLGRGSNPCDVNIYIEDLDRFSKELRLRDETKDKENAPLLEACDNGTLVPEKPTYSLYTSKTLGDGQLSIIETNFTDLERSSCDSSVERKVSANFETNQPLDAYEIDSSSTQSEEAICAIEAVTPEETANPVSICESFMSSDTLEKDGRKEASVDEHPILVNGDTEPESGVAPPLGIPEKLLNNQMEGKSDENISIDESSRKEETSKKSLHLSEPTSEKDILIYAPATGRSQVDVDVQVDDAETSNLFSQLNELRAQFEELKQEHQHCKGLREEATRQYECLQREYDKILLQNKGYGETFKLFTQKESKFIQDISQLNAKYENALLEITQLKASVEEYQNDNLLPSEKSVNMISRSGTVESSPCASQILPAQENLEVNSKLSAQIHELLPKDTDDKNISFYEKIEKEHNVQQGNDRSLLSTSSNHDDEKQASLLALDQPSIQFSEGCTGPIDHKSESQSLLVEVGANFHPDETRRQEKVEGSDPELIKLKHQKEDYERTNDILRSELRSLKEEFELVAYQNKTASVCAIVPLLILSLAIIFAYYPSFSSVTGTMES